MSLPIDTNAERALLACVLVAPDSREVMDLASDLVPDDFADRECAAGFLAMWRLDAANQAIDAVTLQSALGPSSENWIESLHRVPASIASVPTYVARIRELAQRRQMLNAARTIVAQATDAEIRTPDFLDASEAAVLNAAERRRQANDATTMREVAMRLQHRITNPETLLPAVKSGIYRLDEELNGGARPGQFIVIGARPGIGKTSLGTGWASNSGRRGNVTVMFSLEMTRDEMGQRIVVSECRVDLGDMIAGKLTDLDRNAVHMAASLAADWPIVIDDTPAVTLAAIRARCRRVKREHGSLGLVVIDYLQLMGLPPATSGQRYEREQQAIGAISKGLKSLAKELQVPVIAMSQLNRKSEDRIDKRPQLADLRASGDIEQDADVVILLHRPHDKDGPIEGIAEIIIAKQRNGATNAFRVAWLAHCASFAPLAANSDRAYS